MQSFHDRQIRAGERQGQEGKLSRPLITALINTYNDGQFVEAAIGSVLAPDYPSERIETLVVDDGSTDDNAEHLKKYEMRIKYLQKPNGGQASAFNFGVERATGEMIAFLDADDYWLPEKLSKSRMADRVPPLTLVLREQRARLLRFWAQTIIGCLKLRVMNGFNTLAGQLIGYDKFSALYKAELRGITLLKRLTAYP